MFAPVAPWSKIPFLRMLLPLIAGILLQWYLQFDVRILFFTESVTLLCLIAYFFIPVHQKFRLRRFAGIGINLVLLAAGGLLVYLNDPGQELLDTTSKKECFYIGTIVEPPVLKPR
jgi:competence protein ComEC